MGARDLAPWWLRIALKLALSRMPIPYRVWKRIGLFSHGEMSNPQVAFQTFMHHARTAGLVIEGAVPRFRGAEGGSFNVLELGPGDSPFSAAFATALGASGTWLVDSGRFATEDPEAYWALHQFLESSDVPRENGSVADSLARFLEAYRATYLTEGAKSLGAIADASIDYCFSNAVLEHVRLAELPELARHLFRLIRPQGVTVHRVDLQDHIGGALNNLRFSPSTWESEFFASSGFYTNRIGIAEMVEIFERAGFRCETPTVLRWDSLPTPRERMHRQFRHKPEEDLTVYAFDLVGRKVA